nr:hypothetical protein GCM10020092_075740 [Actinoplanes digitatis]
MPPVSSGSPQWTDDPARPPIAWLPLGAVASATAVLLVIFSGRYGYHRDELYYVVA